MISEKTESSLCKAIDDRIEYIRAKSPITDAYPQMVGFFEGLLPGLLTENQAKELIKRLNHRTKKVAP
jgi:hypothetical protein